MICFALVRVISLFFSFWLIILIVSFAFFASLNPVPLMVVLG